MLPNILMLNLGWLDVRSNPKRALVFGQMIAGALDNLKRIRDRESCDAITKRTSWI